MSASHYDAIVVGGGHNGVVAGAYLARAGLSVLVLERREVSGGLAAPLEFFPGYTASITNSPGSLEPLIIAELELEKHGLHYLKPEATLTFPFPDGRRIVTWRDRDRTLAELAAFSQRDADRFQDFFAYLDEFAALTRASIWEAPPPFAEMTSHFTTPRHEAMFQKIMFGSVQSLLDEWFESPQIKALIASVAIVANLAGPKTPGTVQRMLSRPLSVASSAMQGDDDPRRHLTRGTTGLPIGGMGAIAKAFENSFLAAGGHLVTGAEVIKILVKDGGVTGVALADGREYSASVVLSNLNPKTTLLSLLPEGSLPDELRRSAENLEMSGSAFKVGLALSEMPRFASARDDDEARVMAGGQFRIAPTLDYVQDAYIDAIQGKPSRKPMLWGLTPSVVDPSVVPEGRHVMSLNVFHAPHELAEGTWAEQKDAFGHACIDALQEYIPNLKSSIIEARFWSPIDLEREYGLVGANIWHGDFLPAHTFSFRPIPGISNYRLPVRGAYLCGSGSWPGGSVSGVPGRNSAMAVLADKWAATR